jgi:hypothetical protein
MVYLFFIGLGLAAFVGTLWWRRRITRQHTAFKTKVEQASDEEHAKRLHQHYLRKK